jgi:hypothetical protein
MSVYKALYIQYVIWSLLQNSVHNINKWTKITLCMSCDIDNLLGSKHFWSSNFSYHIYISKETCMNLTSNKNDISIINFYLLMMDPIFDIFINSFYGDSLIIIIIIIWIIDYMGVWPTLSPLQMSLLKIIILTNLH